MLKDTLYIDLDEKSHLEVEYLHWGEYKSNDYDVPNDPPGHEVQQIDLVSWVDLGKGHKVQVTVDVTGFADTLSSALEDDKLDQSITENIENR